jgi:hypothetical protein
MAQIIKAAKPRLSDEEIDPLEADDVLASNSHMLVEGWHPWTSEDIVDIRKLIDNKLVSKQQQVMLAFLIGQNHNDIGVTEKYFRYHLLKAVQFIRKELRL